MGLFLPIIIFICGFLIILLNGVESTLEKFEDFLDVYGLVDNLVAESYWLSSVLHVFATSYAYTSS